MRDLIAPPDEERFVRVFGEVVIDAVDDEIGHHCFVKGSVQFGRSARNVGVDLAVEPGPVGVDAGELLETGILGSCAKVPFSDVRGAIADLGEGVRDGGMREVQGIGESGNAISGAVLTGENGSPGGRADRSGDTGVGEANAGFGELVEVGRLDERIGSADKIVTVIVGEDEEDVGTRGARKSHAG